MFYSNNDKVFTLGTGTCQLIGKNILILSIHSGLIIPSRI